MIVRTLSFLFSLTPLFLLAQSNYTKGDLVTTNGDTLHGFINYKEWYRNPDNIQFKYKKEDGNAQHFTVENTSWFAIPGYESYASHEVSVSMNPVNLARLTEHVDTVAVSKKVFLKEVLNGDRINLYTYNDEVKQRFYILDKRETRPQELIYRKSVKDMQEVSAFTFRQQLFTLAVQLGVFNLSLDNLIKTAGYSKGDLQKIVEKMNSVNETGLSREIDKKKSVGVFARLGVNRNRMDYTGENLITIDRINSSGYNKFKDRVTTQNYLPIISTGFDFYVNPAIGRLVISTQLLAAQMKSSVQSFYQYNEYTKPVENNYTFSAWNISFIPQLVYNFYNTPKYKCYGAAGPSINYLLIGKNSMQKREVGSTEVKTEDGFIPFKQMSLNAAVRAGVLIKQRLDLSVTWSNPGEQTIYATGNSSIKTGLLALTAGYYFK